MVLFWLSLSFLKKKKMKATGSNNGGAVSKPDCSQEFFCSVCCALIHSPCCEHYKAGLWAWQGDLCWSKVISLSSSWARETNNSGYSQIKKMCFYCLFTGCRNETGGIKNIFNQQLVAIIHLSFYKMSALVVMFVMIAVMWFKCESDTWDSHIRDKMEQQRCSIWCRLRTYGRGVSKCQQAGFLFSNEPRPYPCWSYVKTLIWMWNATPPHTHTPILYLKSKQNALKDVLRQACHLTAWVKYGFNPEGAIGWGHFSHHMYFQHLLFSL